MEGRATGFKRVTGFGLPAFLFAGLLAALIHGCGWNPFQSSENEFQDMVAFSSDVEGQFDIFLVGLDGGGLRKLTDSGKYCYTGAFDPVWSPDGNSIVCRMQRYREGDYVNYEDLLILSPGGGEPIQLTRGPYHETAPSFDIERSPSWNATGTELVFISSKPYASDKNFPGVHLIVVETRRVTRLFDIFYPGTMDWFRDGRLVYADNARIYLKEDIRSTIRESLGEGSHPRWSPGGDEIVFDFEGAVWLMRADGSDRRKIIDEGTDPCWTSDGQGIVFVVAGENSTKISRCDLRSGKVYDVVDNGAQNLQPCCNPAR